MQTDCFRSTLDQIFDMIKLEEKKKQRKIMQLKNYIWYNVTYSIHGTLGRCENGGFLVWERCDRKMVAQY